ncbi:MAG: acyl-CoA thioesterase [Mucilaginibacter sp.]|nr:acyl-CoA thioesterase [Mucilaginibacter sp.]
MSAERDADDPVALARAVAARMMRADRVAPSLGIEVEEVGPGYATAAMTVSATMINGVGILHGGYTFLLADCAFALACNSYGVDTVSRSCDIEFLAPARVGDRLRASATERHRHGRRGIYDVVVRRTDGTAIAEFRGHSSSFGSAEPRDD